MAVLKAEKLSCDCGSTHFLGFLELTKHPGQGITTKTVGYKCLSCSETMDMDRQAKLLELRRRRAELEEMTQEITELEEQNIS